MFCSCMSWNGGDVRNWAILEVNISEFRPETSIIARLVTSRPVGNLSRMFGLRRSSWDRGKRQYPVGNRARSHLLYEPGPFRCNILNSQNCGLLRKLRVFMCPSARVTKNVEVSRPDRMDLAAYWERSPLPWLPWCLFSQQGFTWRLSPLSFPSLSASLPKWAVKGLGLPV